MISIWQQFNCHIADKKCHLQVDIVYSSLKTPKTLKQHFSVLLLGELWYTGYDWLCAVFYVRKFL